MLPWGVPVYVTTGVWCKEMPLNIPVFKWDLNQYSPSIKINVEEVDNVTTTVVSESTATTFAANFNFDSGTWKKIGLKFGTSAQEVHTVSYNRTYTEGNDELGEAIVNFADNVIFKDILQGTFYESKTYSGGNFYWLTLEPMRAQ